MLMPSVFGKDLFDDFLIFRFMIIMKWISLKRNSMVIGVRTL